MVYNVLVDPYSLCMQKARGFFIEKTEPERGSLPPVLLNPRDCVILDGSTRLPLSGFLYE